VRVLACDLGAFDAVQRARYSALRAELAARRLDVRESADGYVFDFPTDPESIRALAEFVTLERRCCPFFDFALDVPAEAQRVHLRIGGGADVKEFLRGRLT
jgi:hypothetical protein